MFQVQYEANMIGQYEGQFPYQEFLKCREYSEDSKTNFNFRPTVLPKEKT